MPELKQPNDPTEETSDEFRYGQRIFVAVWGFEPSLSTTCFRL